MRESVFRRWVTGTVVGVLGWLASSMATADSDNFPSRPVTIIVPWPPGSIVDVRVRLIAEAASRDTGHRVIVDNRPGAIGTVGVGVGVRARPDGYTVITGDITQMSIVPAMRRDLPYDPERDLVPIILYTRGLMLLVASPSLGASSVAELVAVARKRGTPLLYGTSGPGSTSDFGAILLGKASGIAVERVAYKSSTHALVDVIPGRIDFVFDFVPTSLEHIRAGKLKALMVTSDHRVPLLPDVPTAREAGLPDVQIETWGGFYVPKGTPPAAVAALNRIFARALGDPAIRKNFEDAGSRVGGGSPEDLAAFQALQKKRWTDIVARVGIPE